MSRGYSNIKWFLIALAMLLAIIFQSQRADASDYVLKCTPGALCINYYTNCTAETQTGYSNNTCPSSGQCVFKAKTDGTDCSSGTTLGKCESGQCNTSFCRIYDYVTKTKIDYGSYTRSSSNDCKMCLPWVSQTAWSNAPEDAPCDTSDPCNVSVCKLGACTTTANCSRYNDNCNTYQCSGTLGCQASPKCPTGFGCNSVTGECSSICGDGMVRGSEVCDKTDFAGKTCSDYGFYSGSLSCSSDCSTVKTTGCSGMCHDGTIQTSNEVCDFNKSTGDPIFSNGLTCSNFPDASFQPFKSGTLGCGDDCTSFNTSACYTCGNKHLEYQTGQFTMLGYPEDGEECDKDASGNVLLASQFTNTDCSQVIYADSEGIQHHFAAGKIGCSATCQMTCQKCGNGFVDSGETCDGTSFQGKSCTSLGFKSGTLTCSSGCSIDTSTCSCDDSNPCTTDSKVSGTCSNVKMGQGDACTSSGTAGFCKLDSSASGGILCNVSQCYIGGVFYDDQTKNPSNECQICDVKTSKSAWTNKTNGSTCSDGNVCTTDSCQAGSCVSANVTSGTECLSSTGAKGQCLNTGKANYECFTNSCYFTDATTGITKFYYMGVANPNNSCQVCNPDISRTTWSSVLDGKTCDDSNSCTIGDTCKAGACVGGPLKDTDVDGYPDKTCGGTDCNDNSAAINPGATEICDGIDNNCNSQTDEGFSVGQTCTAGTGVCQNSGVIQCKADKSGSECSVTGKTGTCDDKNLCTYGDTCSGGTSSTCSGTSYSCDDSKSCTTDACTGDGKCTNIVTSGCLINGACVAKDAEDPTNKCMVCNPLISTTAYSPKTDGVSCEDGDACTVGDVCKVGQCTSGAKKDADGDGHIASSCGGDDCNDNNATIYTGAVEICDNKDNNCNGTVDEGFDKDADGYSTCSTQYPGKSLDCNDNDPTIYPGAPEKCDGINSNCNALDDTVDVKATACYTGPTGTQGVGTCKTGLISCVNNGGVYSLTSCVGEVLPLATEACDGLDSNCNGVPDYTEVASKACYTGPSGTEGIGVCKGGVQTCNRVYPSGATWSSCTGEVKPRGGREIEECNKRDDNCDGILDNYYNPNDPACTDLCGKTGVWSCVGISIDASGQPMAGTPVTSHPQCNPMVLPKDGAGTTFDPATMTLNDGCVKVLTSSCRVWGRWTCGTNGLECVATSAQTSDLNRNGTPDGCECTDNNPCTDDVWDNTQIKCVITNNDANTCTDGNQCTSGDKCQSGRCVSGTAVAPETKTIGSGDCAYQQTRTCSSNVWSSWSGSAPSTTFTDTTACTGQDTCGGSRVGTCNADGKTINWGACQYAATSVACTDGDQCTSSDHCDGSGKCVGAAVPQESKTVGSGDCAYQQTRTCSSNVWSAWSGSAPTKTFTDTTACTGQDTCGGSRVGTCNADGKTINWGACQYAATSVACTDGDQCTSSDHCDGSGKCVGVAVPQETKPVGEGNCAYQQTRTCSSNVWSAWSGSAPSTTFTDTTACTGQDTCGGSRVGTCNADGKTINWGACQYAATSVACTDGDQCTSSDHCDGSGKCVGAAVPQESKTVGSGDCAYQQTRTCSSNVWSAWSGSAPTKTFTDTTACTGQDTCGGSRVGTCNADGNTINWGACQYAPITQSCEDGNLCTTGDTCDAKGSCISGKAVTCTASDKCHDVGTCDQKTGLCSNPLLPDPNTDPTKVGECETRKCDPVNFGWQSVPDGEKIGKSCTADTNVCTDDICNSSGQCAHNNNTAACTTNNKCMTGEICGDGTCGGGTAVNCDDGNVCTTDSCDSAVGCSHVCVANAGQYVLVGEVLCENVNGVCEPKGPPECKTSADCDDKNPCTENVCDSDYKCTYPASPVSKTCDDGSLCTLNDHCDGSGSCASGAQKDCSDNLACTTDACDPKSGLCSNKLADGCLIGGQCYAAGTNPGNECQQCVNGGTEWVNKIGSCSDDSDQCTSDYCDAGVCKHSQVPNRPYSVANEFGKCDGTEVCSNNKWAGDAKTPEAEQCNGVDDNCNGQVDENLSKTCQNGCGMPGTQTCSNGVWSECVVPTVPELCGDGIDNNCNGQVDEGFNVGADCSTDICNKGTIVCDPNDKTKSICKIEPQNGVACDDHNLCTDNDACNNGVCGGTEKVCANDDTCSISECDMATGECKVEDNPLCNIEASTKTSKIFDLSKTRAVFVPLSSVDSVSKEDKFAVISGKDEAGNAGFIKVNYSDAKASLEDANTPLATQFYPGTFAGLNDVGDVVYFDSTAAYIAGKTKIEMPVVANCEKETLKGVSIVSGETGSEYAMKIGCEGVADQYITVRLSEGTAVAETDVDLSKLAVNKVLPRIITPPAINKTLLDNVFFGSRFNHFEYAEFEKTGQLNIVSGGPDSIMVGLVDEANSTELDKALGEQSATVVPYDKSVENITGESTADKMVNSEDYMFVWPKNLTAVEAKGYGGADMLSVFQYMSKKDFERAEAEEVDPDSTQPKYKPAAVALFIYFNKNEPPECDEIALSNANLSTNCTDPTSDSVTGKWTCEDSTGNICDNLFVKLDGFETAFAPEFIDTLANANATVSINSVAKAIGGEELVWPLTITFEGEDSGGMSVKKTMTMDTSFKSSGETVTKGETPDTGTTGSWSIFGKGCSMIGSKDAQNNRDGLPIVVILGISLAIMLIRRRSLNL